MNEIIKVSYQNETPTVSGRELHEAEMQLIAKRLHTSVADLLQD